MRSGPGGFLHRAAPKSERRYNRDDWREPWRVYLGLVALLDHCVGKLVAKLKGEGLYDDAVIVFTADHGEMLGSHQLWQKMCNYEESTRVPLSIKLPSGANAVTTVTGNVSHLDVLPTLCDLLDLPRPDTLSGISLLPAMASGTAPDRDIFVHFDGNGACGNFSRCVVRGRDKLIVDVFKDEVFLELYDLEADHQETNNLPFEQPDRARILAASLASDIHTGPQQASLQRRNSSFSLFPSVCMK